MKKLSTVGTETLLRVCAIVSVILLILVLIGVGYSAITVNQAKRDAAAAVEAAKSADSSAQQADSDAQQADSDASRAADSADSADSGVQQVCDATPGC